MIFFLHRDRTAGKQNNFCNNIKKKHTHRWRQATKSKDTHSRQVNIGHHQENPRVLCVADPHLGSVDDVIIFVLLCTSLQRESVAPWLCFWEAETSNLSQAGKQQVSLRVTVNKNTRISSLRATIEEPSSLSAMAVLLHLQRETESNSPCRWRAG